MRHAAVAVMFVGLGILALALGFTAQSKPVDEWDQGGYVMHDSPEEAMEYALRALAVMDSIDRETAHWDSVEAAHADEPFGGWECGQ